MVGTEDDSYLVGVGGDKSLGCIEGSNPPVIYNRQSVAEPFCLIHEVGDHDNSGAPITDGADKVPGYPSGGWIQSGGHLVEEHNLGVIHQGKGNKKSLALTSRQAGE